MKKILLSILMMCLVLVGCQGKVEKQSESKKTVAATTSFLSDIVTEITKGAVEIETIIPAGEDPHLYVAKASDLDKLKKANLVLYHGLHFEGKMVETLEKVGKAVSKDFPEERLGKLDEDGETVVDPHFWFDITLYKKAVMNASVELQGLLPEKKEEFSKNEKAYLQKLDDLDKWIKEQLAQIPVESRYLITPHDAFNYFAKNYNVKVHAPQGISTDSEVDTSAIIETANLIIEHKIKAIFAESTTSPERMKKLQEAVKAKGFDVEVVSGEGKELFSDSLAPKGEKGDNFIDMYKHNIELIVKHLK